MFRFIILEFRLQKYESAESHRQEQPARTETAADKATKRIAAIRNPAKERLGS